MPTAATNSKDRQQDRYGSADARPDSSAYYEQAGPTLLAQQPSEPTKKKTKAHQDADVRVWTVIRDKCDQVINGLRMWRNSWWYHWSLISKFLLPRRFTWWQGTVPTANAMIHGSPINQAILDSTGSLAVHVCSAGLMNGSASPSRPWYKFKIGLPGVDPTDEQASYFEDVETRIYAVMASSNFYDSLSQVYEDLVVFGTAVMIIYEDDADAIRCYVSPAGEYYIGSSSTFRAETMARQFLMTVSQTVEMFSLDKCPESVQGLWKTKGASLQVEKIISHLIEPNYPIQSNDGEDVKPVSADFPWREIYWVFGEGGSEPLSAKGFWEQPYMCPRWSTTGNDPYGRGPGMDTLPDVMQLQQEVARKAEAIDKLVRPPIVADATLKNQPSSTLPGGVTFVANLAQSSGMRPVYQVQPAIKEMMEDLNEVRQRIKAGFFNDIFLMIAEQTKDQTAYEIAKKYEEKLQVLGPIIERQQNELLGPAIKRIFRIMERKGLLPPLPKSLQGVPLDIEYISIIAIAQRATATAAIERVLQVAGNMAAAPAMADVLDNIDPDATIREYAELVDVTTKIFRNKSQVDQMRQQRAQAQQAQQQAQTAMAAVQGAQTLSQTEVGGGTNALQSMLGNMGQKGVS
jgi:hypothetical protein